MDERDDEVRRVLQAPTSRATLKMQVFEHASRDSRHRLEFAVRVVCYIARRLVEPCASSSASTQGPDMVNSSVGAPLGRPTAARLGLPFPMPPKFIVS